MPDKLPSAKNYSPGTKKKSKGKTYIVAGHYGNTGKILKSTQHWVKLTASNKYLDSKNSIAKSKKRISKRVSKKRVSKKRVSKKRVSKKRVSKRVSKKRVSKKLKYNRPSPAQSATLYNIGTKKRGNDGSRYIVIKTSNGVKRWIKEH